MRKLYELFRQMIYGGEIELRERIFRMIILVGGGLAMAGILESLILMDINVILFPLLVLLVVLGAELLITFKYRRIDLAAMIVGFFIILVVFPGMFYLSGGLKGGAPLWFALGLFYVFLMFSGKKLIFFLILSLVVDAFTYVFCYWHPEIVVPMDSELAAYFDSLFSVFAVGLAVGAILKVQARMFYIERSVARRQQEELEEISDSKNSFFASMSHEIRTPINTIVGLNEMILRESGEAQTREYAANIRDASSMLLNLVNDILDLSQLEMKKMEIIPLEYKTSELFEGLINMIRVRLKEKKLKFLVDIDENLPAVLFGDMKRINQVVLNILTNAAKYTETGSVTLSVHVEPAGEGEVFLRISVADTGIGIKKEELEYIYESFKRMDERKNLKVEGSGLGLSITKQLVDLMDGEITVDSIYMRGSTFTVVLPQMVVDSTPIGYVNFLAGSRAETEEYQPSFEAPEARILIVDDNPMNALVESKLLEATKVQIDVAENGMHCLEMTKRKYYHVILMDYLMPELDGVSTLRQLRKQENGLCRESAVVVLSANSMAESGGAYLEDGFDGYLEKPVRGALLEAELLKFIPEDIIEYRLETGGIGQEIDSGMQIRRVNRSRKKKVYITTDCDSDLPGNLAEKYDIGLMYLYIRTERGRFSDVLEIASDNLTQYMTDTKSTAFADGVSVEECEEFFAEALTRAEEVIHISMARHVGKTYEVAVAAARGFGHVHVIDSSHVSCGQALVALYAGKLAMERYDTAAICERVEKIKKRIMSRYIMPGADLLYQRGFVNKATAMVCGLFHLHPVLRMSQSKMTVAGIRAGKMDGAWRRFIRRHLRRKSRISTDVVFISHVGCSVEQQELIREEILRWIPFRKVIMQRASVSIACSAGIGTFGFAYYSNQGEEQETKE